MAYLHREHSILLFVCLSGVSLKERQVSSWGRLKLYLQGKHNIYTDIV